MSSRRATAAPARRKEWPVSSWHDVPVPCRDFMLFSGALRERFAQSPNMDINGAQFDFRVLAPYLVEQLLARKHPARLLQEMPQQAELGRAEVDRLSGARDPVRHEIHRDIGIAQRRFARIRLRPPDDRAQP